VVLGTILKSKKKKHYSWRDIPPAVAIDTICILETILVIRCCITID